MGTVIHDEQRGNIERKQRRDRSRRAELLDQYDDLQAQGVSQRQAAKVLHVPRTTLQEWRMWQGRLHACPHVVRFFESVASLAFLIQSTSDEAPGLLAYVERHLGAHHSPDLFHVQRELSKEVSALMAIKQRAAAKAVTQAEETLKRVQIHLNNATSTPEKRGPGGPPKAAASPEPDSAGCGSRSPRAPAPHQAARAGRPEHSRHRPRLPLC